MSKVRLSGIFDFDLLGDGKVQLSGVSDFEILSDDPPVQFNLPSGYDSDVDVAYGMLITSMTTHGITPVSSQGHGKEVAAALNEDWPGLDCYAHNVSDALMWPGFGSVDFTISSGEGGFYFRPDGLGSYGEGRPKASTSTRIRSSPSINKASTKHKS